MKIPSGEADLTSFLSLIIDSCTASQRDRQSLYEKRRRYYLYGQNKDFKVRFNRLKAHMNLVSSFLFSPESLTYSITPPKNANAKTVQQFLALQDDWNEDVHDSGVADTFAEAVTWALNFDTMVLKMGWNDINNQLFAELIEPSCFGVYREDKSDFTSQPAMNHTFLLDYDDACQRLKKAGKESEMNRLKVEGESEETGLPPALNQLIINATGGENVMGNIMGSVNPDYESNANFRSRVIAPMVRFNETWIWDSDENDYRIFHSLDGPVLLSDSKKTISILSAGGKEKFDSTTNWYLAKENPFVPITPFGLYNLFWGDCHQEDIIPLQNWSNERLLQIDETLREQVDPAKSFVGFQGLSDEKMAAWGGPGTAVADSMPGAKVEEHRPPMPDDLFREFNEIGSLMMEASGLTEIVAGKSSGGARGGAQQKQLQVTGGGAIKKTAVRLEGPLVRMGDLAMKLKRKNDDTHILMPDGTEFVAAQVPEDYSIHVSGHSHSPLFTMGTQELTDKLFKSQAIDREWYIRLNSPPQMGNLIQSLRAREQAEAKAKAANPPPEKKKK